MELNSGDDSVGVFELLGPGYSSHLSLVESNFVGYAYDHRLAFLDVPGEHKSGTVSVGFDSGHGFHRVAGAPRGDVTHVDLRAVVHSAAGVGFFLVRNHWCYKHDSHNIDGHPQRVLKTM